MTIQKYFLVEKAVKLLHFLLFFFTQISNKILVHMPGTKKIIF